MTRRKPLHRMAALLLCVFLCLGAAFSMMGAAHAANTEPSGITIEIMLPPDWANTSAAAKVCVTDETGGGFASAEVRIDRSGGWRDITARADGVSLLELKQRLDALTAEQAVLLDKVLEDMDSLELNTQLEAVTAEKQGICIQSNSPKCCFCFIDTAIDYNRRTIHNSSCT